MGRVHHSQRIDAGERYADVAAAYDVTPSAVWWRVRQWRRDQAAAASVTAVGREHIPGARPKPISLAQVQAAIDAHGSQVQAARARGVSRNLVRARLAELGEIKHPNASREARLGGESRKRLPLCHH